MICFNAALTQRDELPQSLNHYRYGSAISSCADWTALFAVFLCHSQRKATSVGPAVNESSRPVFLNPRAAARYRALASIIPGREKFSWNLSF